MQNPSQKDPAQTIDMTDSEKKDKKPPVTSASGTPTTDTVGNWKGDPKLRRMFAASRDYPDGDADKKE